MYAVADHKGNAVILEVLEHCHVWWFPPFVNQDVSMPFKSLFPLIGLIFVASPQ